MGDQPPLPGGKPKVPGGRPKPGGGKPSVPSDRPAVPGGRPSDSSSSKPSVPRGKPPVASGKPPVPAASRPTPPSDKPPVPADDKPGGKPPVPAGSRPSAPGGKPSPAAKPSILRGGRGAPARAASDGTIGRGGGPKSPNGLGPRTKSDQRGRARLPPGARGIGIPSPGARGGTLSPQASPAGRGRGFPGPRGGGAGRGGTPRAASSKTLPRPEKRKSVDGTSGAGMNGGGGGGSDPPRKNKTVGAAEGGARRERPALSNDKPPPPSGNSFTSTANSPNGAGSSSSVPSGGVSLPGDDRRARLRHILSQSYHQALLPNDPGKDKAKGHVFGHSLYYILKREKRRIPLVVEQIMVQLLSSGDCERLEGIFRLSGGANDVAAVRSQFNKGKTLENGNFAKSCDGYVFAAVLKMFFRELAQPVVPEEQFHDLLNIAGVPGEARKLALIQAEIDKLPIANRELLGCLLVFLDIVSTFHEATKMQAQNLAIVFGPNVIRYEGLSPLEEMAHSVPIGEIFSFMIEHARFLDFGDGLVEAMGAGGTVAGVASGGIASAAAAAAKANGGSGAAPPPPSDKPPQPGRERRKSLNNPFANKRLSQSDEGVSGGTYGGGGGGASSSSGGGGGGGGGRGAKPPLPGNGKPPPPDDKPAPAPGKPAPAPGKPSPGGGRPTPAAKKPAPGGGRGKPSPGSRNPSQGSLRPNVPGGRPAGGRAKPPLPSDKPPEDAAPLMPGGRPAGGGGGGGGGGRSLSRNNSTKSLASNKSDDFGSYKSTLDTVNVFTMSSGKPMMSVLPPGWEKVEELDGASNVYVNHGTRTLQRDAPPKVDLHSLEAFITCGGCHVTLGFPVGRGQYVQCGECRAVLALPS